MPTHSGISFEVLSQLELSILPEFPHPESSQFTFRSPGRTGKSKTAVADWSPPAVSAVSKADALLGRNTTCSVYVPSFSGSQFWLRYELDAAAQLQSKFYYFKLFMNGRHIASFGVDAVKRPHGQIMHGLFDPSSVWNYEHNGEIWKNNGLEVRPFFFGRANKKQSVANDGGLVEVLCFRANSRRRKLPDPEVWRDQQDYGIETPSQGLHKKPEEAKFYDWYLLDPKNTPFVVFKFHYRSWDSLQTLELIPPGYRRALLPPRRQILPSELQAMLEIQKKEHHFLGRPHSPCEDCKPSVPGSPPIDDTELNNCNDSYPKPSEDAYDEQEFLSENEVSPLAVRRHRRRVPRSRFTEIVEDEPSSTGSPACGEHEAIVNFLDRPLPEIPVRKSSKLRLARTSSVKSKAPSITPSLISALDRDAVDRDCSSPEPEILQAKIVPILGPISPPRKPRRRLDSHPMDDNDSIEAPVKTDPIVETRISTEDSMLHSIEEMSPMLPRHRSPSPTGFSPGPPLTAIRLKPVAHMALADGQYFAAPSQDYMLSSPNFTIRKHRRSTFRNIPKSNTTTSLPSQDEKQVPLFAPMRNLSFMNRGPPEDQWMARSKVPPSSSMPSGIRSGLGHASAWKPDSPELPTSSSIQSGFKSNYTYASSVYNSSGLKNVKTVMKVVAAKSSTLGHSLKRNSKNLYLRTRSSMDLRASEDSTRSSQNSFNTSEASGSREGSV